MSYARRAPRAASFKPSAQQSEFFRNISEEHENIFLEAVAGAGKTTTLIQALALMDGSVFFGAYNKKIASEIKLKADEARVSRFGIYISTLHAAGFGAWKRYSSTCVVDDRKSGKCVQAMVATDGLLYPMLGIKPFIFKMVSFGKQLLAGIAFDIDDAKEWRKISDHYSADQYLPDGYDMAKAIDFVIRTLKYSNDRCREIIDFDDMIYAPLLFNLNLFQNDWVLIDEAQDTNPARRELARRMLKSDGRFVAVGDSRQNGRFIAVGDSRQAIYGWTGAGDDAVDKIIAEFKCKRLPLTFTYRCPKAVVDYAHNWVTHIQAHANAPQGTVRAVRTTCSHCDGKPPRKGAKPCPVCKGKGVAWFQADRPGPQDAVLCRYTRPLVKTAYAMLRVGIACKVEGRDIGNGLIVMAQRFQVRDIDALDARLGKFLDDEAAKAKESESEKRLQNFEDVVSTLQIFIDRARERGEKQISSLIADIETLFADDVKGVTTLSTGHKAKGREWGTVYWIQTEPRQHARKDWEKVQEENISYVICTRAQSELILVPEALTKGDR